MIETKIKDTNDFLDKYGLNQCEADYLCQSLRKNEKEKVFNLFKDARVNEKNYQEYYEIMKKDFDKTLNIIEDNTYLKDDIEFSKLDNEEFMFSCGDRIQQGLFYDGLILGHCAQRYERKEIKQIWIIKENK